MFILHNILIFIKKIGEKARNRQKKEKTTKTCIVIIKPKRKKDQLLKI